jgi:hypothetical protein
MIPMKIKNITCQALIISSLGLYQGVRLLSARQPLLFDSSIFASNS